MTKISAQDGVAAEVIRAAAGGKSAVLPRDRNLRRKINTKEVEKVSETGIL
jgi:hypothetical protein